MKFLFLLALAVSAVPVRCVQYQDDSRFSPIDSTMAAASSWPLGGPAPNLDLLPRTHDFVTTGKEVTARSIAPDVVEVNILVRLYWQSIRGAKPRFYRHPDTQRDYDRKAEEAWSGVFRHRHMFKTLTTYIVRTRILSTYGDIGAPYPDRSSTVVLQMGDYGCASAFAVRDPGAGKFGSIILHQNNRPSDYIHEIGHILGCADRYESQGPEPGWEWNIMANPAKAPDYRNIEEILRNAVAHEATAVASHSLSPPGSEPGALPANAPARRSGH
jgi:hypothetical protein